MALRGAGLSPGGERAGPGAGGWRESFMQGAKRLGQWWQESQLPWSSGCLVSWGFLPVPSGDVFPPPAAAPFHFWTLPFI